MRGQNLLTCGCRARNGLVALALAGLASCADPAQGWQREAVTPAQRETDYQDCRSLVREASHAGVTQDIAATRAAQGFHTGRPELPADTVAMDERAADAALVDCMTEKGYRHD